MTQGDDKQPKQPLICPPTLAPLLTTRLRQFLLHNPKQILQGIIREGQTALDIGCGPGFFTLDMARLVGEKGHVIAADLQPKMLAMLCQRAEVQGLATRIDCHECQSDRINLDKQVDFVLAFYMLHEVANQQAFLEEIYALLKPHGQLLLAEPKFHVSASAYERTLKIAQGAGFTVTGVPRITLSRAALLIRDMGIEEK